MSDKPTVTWEAFQAERAAVVWARRAAQHRREGCAECAAGGCISAASPA